MKLYIDTTSTDELKISLDEKSLVLPARQNKSQLLLKAISNLLIQNKKALKDLNEIEVNIGPGSYTGLRVGISVANALGFSLNIRVNNKRVLKDGPVEPVYNS